MILQSISLQNFRSYSKSQFSFSAHTTIVVGENTSGKSNLIEAIYCIATGKSFRTDKDADVIQFDKDFARVSAVLEDDDSSTSDVQVFISTSPRLVKKYTINTIAKRRVDFAALLPAVLFSPEDLELVIGSPSLRRNFLDEALEQSFYDYRFSKLQYGKALKQRNALLHLASETGRRNEKQFEYWDEMLIVHGKIITSKREEFIAFLNTARKELFDTAILYDKSEISKERLLQYKDAEAGYGVTLVGPHRDDFEVSFFDNTTNTARTVKLFGSRGQQRLVVLQLKLLERAFLEKTLQKNPLLLLDDIYSELDANHIELVSSIIPNQQTIITTTHKEFIQKKLLLESSVLELEKAKP